MATTDTTSDTFTLPFLRKALADRDEQVESALDRLAGLGLPELPRPLSYWQTELAALLRALTGAADPRIFLDKDAMSDGDEPQKWT